MSKTKKSKGYKKLYPYLKWLFSGLSVYFFAKQLQSIEGNLLTDIIAKLTSYPIVLTLIFLLALINWNAEAQKFKLLIASEIHLSNQKAFLTILGGMAISNFTPARTGEYIGRGLLLKKIHPIKVVIATVAGNIAQVLMTYSLGLLCIGVALLITDFGSFLTDSSKIIYVGISFLITLLFLRYITYFIAWVKSKLPHNLAKTLNLVNKYDRKLYVKVIGIAFLRYFAFAIQFYLLLQLFSDFSLPLFTIVFVPIAYLLQSLVPVPAVSDIGVRIAVSQMLFGVFLADNRLLQAIVCLWFVNLILPGLLGTVYLLTSTIRQR